MLEFCWHQSTSISRGFMPCNLKRPPAGAARAAGSNLAFRTWMRGSRPMRLWEHLICLGPGCEKSTGQKGFRNFRLWPSHQHFLLGIWKQSIACEHFFEGKQQTHQEYKTCWTTSYQLSTITETQEPQDPYNKNTKTIMTLFKPRWTTIATTNHTIKQNILKLHKHLGCLARAWQSPSLIVACLKNQNTKESAWNEIHTFWFFFIFRQWSYTIQNFAHFWDKEYDKS